MSEPFPSPEYIKLCTQPEVADRLREAQEKRGARVGDWVLCWDGDERHWGDEAWLVLGEYTEDAIDVMLPDGVGGPVLKNEATPLFTLRQLIGLLEERGWRIGRLVDRANPDYRARHERVPDDSPRRWMALIHYRGQEHTDWSAFGPDPETALLRAWLEVVKPGEV